jgi:hypothetical protein
VSHYADITQSGFASQDKADTQKQSAPPFQFAKIPWTIADQCPALKHWAGRIVRLIDMIGDSNITHVTRVAGEPDDTWLPIDWLVEMSQDDTMNSERLRMVAQQVVLGKFCNHSYNTTMQQQRDSKQLFDNAISMYKKYHTLFEDKLAEIEKISPGARQDPNTWRRLHKWWRDNVLMH